MRALLLIVLTVFMTVSCTEDESIISGDRAAFHFYQNASLTSAYPYIVKGNSLVFERYFESDEVPTIADDEYSDQFFFQVSPTGNSFLVEGEDLKNLPSTFNVFCFCAPSDVFEITDGSISGEEIRGVWHVSVNVAYTRGVRNPQNGEVTEVDNGLLIFDGLFLGKDKPAN